MLKSSLFDALAVLVLIVHVACYGGWLIDDAGITFAYARNWVDGHGLVAQPGDEAVEGFTNALWMLVIAGSMWVDGFDLLWTPKVLGTLCAGIGLVVVRRTVVRMQPQSASFASVGTVLTALNPGFAIWVGSGLENGMTALLAAWMLAALTTRPAGRDTRTAVVCGGLAGLMFCNRPDGAIFAAAFPLCVFARVALGRLSMRRGVRSIVIAISVSVAGMLVVTAWRLATFGDFVPNTFHAKGEGTRQVAILAALSLFLLVGWTLLGIGATTVSRETSSARPRWWRRAPPSLRAGIWLAGCLLIIECCGFKYPLRALASPIGAPLFGLGVWCAIRSKSLQRDCELWVFVGLAMLQFGALPRDWMPEYRFATPLLVVGLPILASSLGTGIGTLRGKLRLWSLRVAIVAACVVATKFGIRGLEFSAARTVPLVETQRIFERRYGVWAKMLAAHGRPGDSTSVLTPDVGGPYWSRSVTVHDLAGLCDRRIARCKNRRAELAGLILDTIQPTFIAFHDRFVWRAGVHDHPRFERDYVGIFTATDPVCLDVHARDLAAGIFVRRDALEATGLTLDMLRGAAR